MSNSTGKLVSRLYSNFRGADFRGDEVNLMRSPDCLNVWRNYKKTGGIETRPGLENKVAFDDIVYGIYFFRNMMLVHAGEKLYKVIGEEKTMLFSGLNKEKSMVFVYKDTLYLKDGKNYLQFDGNIVKAVEGYVPTTSIGRSPAGGGATFEDVNLLSPYRINTFVADGKKGDLPLIPDTGSTDYYLDAKDIDRDFTPIVKVNGVDVTDTEVVFIDYAEGKITFKDPPMAPSTDGQPNVSVKFKKTVDGHYDRIAKCRLLQVFDNRVFFSGNPDFPNVVYHCSLDDPSYCSDLDYYNEGLDRAAVNGMVAGNNALWVFRAPSDANTTVFYHTPTIDADYGKIYPSSHSSISTGCIGGAINFNDDIVFFSDRGMEGISGDITAEQVAMHRSSLVDRKLISEENYASMILEEWEGYLLIILGSKIYLADSRAVFTNENHIEYEFFYWDMETDITSAKVHDGILYVGTSDGVCTLTDFACEVESYWVTPKDKFNHPHLQKTTNKRGCVAEATGDVTVFAKTEDTDFEEIGAYKDVRDYFVSRIKRKKWKDIQLKFYSGTRFSLETVTLEAFVGAYIKR